MKVTPEQVREILRETLEVIESGKAKELSIHFDTTDGKHHDFEFKLETPEERDLAAASIRKILGSLH